MSGVTRQKLLTELSAISLASGQNAIVKQNLEITDFDPTNIEIQIEDIETDLENLENEVSSLTQSISAQFGEVNIDINNLDVSLTAVIAEQCLRADSPPVTGSETTVIGSLTVQINGVQYRLALV